MKKQIILRGLLGMPLGVAISVWWSLASFALLGRGDYALTVPSLEAACGSPLAAAAAQTAAVMAYGAMWGGASVIWEVERWSLLRQTVTHFCLTAAGTFPVAWSLGWMTRSLGGAAVYFGIFIGIYALIWAGGTWMIGRRLRKINRRLEE